MNERLHQCELMVELLRQRPMFSHELSEAGIGRPNSRAAQLRRRGFVIDCAQRREGYLYRLVAEPNETAVLEEASSSLAAGSGVSSSAALERPSEYPSESEGTCSSRDRALEIPGEALGEQAGPAETMAAGPAAGVEHEPTCASAIVAGAACDCLAAFALEETPAAAASAAGVSSSGSAAVAGTVRAVDALDLGEQLRLEQDFLGLASLDDGGDA